MLAGLLGRAADWSLGGLARLLAGPCRTDLAARQGCYAGNCSVDFLCRYLKIYEFLFNSQTRFLL